MKEAAVIVAASIFFIVSLLHLARFILKLEVKIGKFVVPLWFSIFGFIFPLALSLWLLK